MRRPDGKNFFEEIQKKQKQKSAQFWEQTQAAGSKGRVVNSFVQRFFSVGFVALSETRVTNQPFLL